MKHLSLKLEKLEERIAPGGIKLGCSGGGSNNKGSKSHGSKGGGSKGGGGSKIKASKCK